MVIIAYGASLPFIPPEQSIQIGVAILVAAVTALSYLAYWAFLGSGATKVVAALRERTMRREVDSTIHSDREKEVMKLSTQIKSIAVMPIPFDQADAAVRMFLDTKADTYLTMQAERQEETRGSVSYYLEPSHRGEEPWYIKTRKVGDRTEVSFWDLNFQLWFAEDESWAPLRKRFIADQAKIAEKLLKYLSELERTLQGQADARDVAGREKLAEYLIKPTSKAKAPSGRPRNPDDEWAREQVHVLGRSKQEVFPEWKARIGERAKVLADPQESFDKAIGKKPKKWE